MIDLLTLVIVTGLAGRQVYEWFNSGKAKSARRNRHAQKVRKR